MFWVFCTSMSANKYIVFLVFLAGLDGVPPALLKHDNEIDRLWLKDGTADKNNCCQHPC